MSQTKAQLVSPVGILTASGVNVSGVVTTSNLNVSGILTAGNINVTGIVTAGNINVGFATVSNNLTVTGNLTVNGETTTLNTTELYIEDKIVGIASTASPSDVYADNAGITIFGTTNKTLTYNNTKKSFETNIPIATNELRSITGAEKVVRISGNTVDLSYNSSSGSNVGYTTNPSGDITVNLNGIPTSSDFDDHSITFAVIVNSTGVARTCTAVNLNGLSKTIRWIGGSLSSAVSGVTTTNGHTIYSFTAVNTVGSASTTSNYEVFGVVNGGFW